MINNPSNIKSGEAKFAQTVKEQSGVNFDLCYQCLTCTLSCPFASTMDLLPNQLVRKIQIGAKEEVLSSRTIWRCASCETCVTRCPNEINIPRLMDTLRQMSRQEKVTAGDNGVAVFHQAFIAGVRQWGRQYELGMLLSFKIRARDLFSDLGLGMKMLQKGKISLMPGRNRSAKEVKSIFRKLKWTD
jgi:heterodisulfide reductase subunit C2